MLAARQERVEPAAAHLFDWLAVQGVQFLPAAPFGRDVAAELTSALAEPVRWRELVQELIAEGAGRFVEPGPGRPLGNLVRRIEPEAEVSALQVPSLAGMGRCR